MTRGRQLREQRDAPRGKYSLPLILEVEMRARVDEAETERRRVVRYLRFLAHLLRTSKTNAGRTATAFEIAANAIVRGDHLRVREEP
jgi:hypothetical protein